MATYPADTAASGAYHSCHSLSGIRASHEITNCDPMLYGRTGVDARSLPPQDNLNYAPGHDAWVWGIADAD
jgi:hypothetical protein